MALAINRAPAATAPKREPAANGRKKARRPELSETAVERSIEALREKMRRWQRAIQDFGSRPSYELQIDRLTETLAELEAYKRARSRNA